MTTVTVHCVVRCVDGIAPSETDVTKMFEQIELYAVRKGYKSIVDTRQVWDSIYWPHLDQVDWIFAIYRDYNAPVAS